MRFSLPRSTAIAATCLASLFLALPAISSAAKYPSGSASGFNDGASGWTSSSSSEGICLAPLLCASAENSFQPTGGADQGGFIRSAYTGVVGATAVGGVTTAVWQSPSFTYDGASGDPPTSVRFTLDRRADVDQLLGVTGNSAEYTVRLVDLSAGGEAVSLIGPTTLAGAPAWTDAHSGPVNPGALTSGHQYRIQITSIYTSGTSALVTGSADYDNVVLEATRSGAGGNGNGNGKGNGKGGLSSDRLRELLREGSAGTGAATLVGKKRLLVRVSCPRKVGRTCRTTAQGLLRKGRPATTKRTVRLRSGKSRLIVLQVKPRARQKLASRKRLLVRQKVRAGKVSATLYKTRKLARR